MNYLRLKSDVLLALSILAIVTSSACSFDPKDRPAQEDSSLFRHSIKCKDISRPIPSWTEAKQIIQFTCVGCHNPAGVAKFRPFTTLAQVRRNAKKMYDEVDDGDMPKDNPRFAGTPEKRKLLDFLMCGDMSVSDPGGGNGGGGNGGGGNGGGGNGGGGNGGGSGPGPEPKYADVKGIIDTNCVSCHNPMGLAGFFPFTTLEEIKPMAVDMTNALADGRMPQGNPTFKDSGPGQYLLRWLRTGSDLQ